MSTGLERSAVSARRTGVASPPTFGDYTGTPARGGQHDRLVVTTALPVISTDLGADLAGAEWTVSAYTLTFAVLLLAGSAMGERFGRRRMFAVGMALFTAGSAAAALAPTIGTLVAARAVQ